MLFRPGGNDYSRAVAVSGAVVVRGPLGAVAALLSSERVSAVVVLLAPLIPVEELVSLDEVTAGTLGAGCAAAADANPAAPARMNEAAIKRRVIPVSMTGRWPRLSEPPLQHHPNIERKILQEK